MFAPASEHSPGEKAITKIDDRILSPGPPPFCDFGQHNSEAAAESAEIDAFSFRVLCTIFGQYTILRPALSRVEFETLSFRVLRTKSMIESSLRAPPPFCDFGQHNSEADAGSTEIAAFSFRVLRTISADFGPVSES